MPVPEEAYEFNEKDAKRQQQRKLLRRYMKQFYLFRTPYFKASGGQASHYGWGASTFLASVGYAIEGLSFAFQQERNFRLDCYLIAGAIGLGGLFQISLAEWALLLQMAGFVLFAELANTVVEWLVDLLTQGAFDIRAKRIKDIAAGACLVVAITSYGVVAIVFSPYLQRLLQGSLFVWGS
jgi:undecaprenol kinase